MDCRVWISDFLKHKCCSIPPILSHLNMRSDLWHGRKRSSYEFSRSWLTRHVAIVKFRTKKSLKWRTLYTSMNESQRVFLETQNYTDHQNEIITTHPLDASTNSCATNKKSLVITFLPFCTSIVFSSHHFCLFHCFLVVTTASSKRPIYW